MSERIIALVLVLLLVTRRLGFDAPYGGRDQRRRRSCRSSFSPINPLPGRSPRSWRAAAAPGAGADRRDGGRAGRVDLGLLASRGRVRRPPEAAADEAGAARRERFDARSAGVLALVLATFAMFVFGVMRLGWDFDQMSALFFAMGVVAGLVGGLGLGGTARGFVTGFTSMAYAGMLIGFARAIFVVLDQGHIIDTLVNALVTPLQQLPVALSALGMMIVQAAIHGPVPSVSGQAVLTMPVLVPMSDLIGLSRQVTVLAYQYGAGLTELVTPTNGALMAVTAAAGVKYGDWLAFVVPLYLLLLGLGAAAIVVAVAVGI